MTAPRTAIHRINKQIRRVEPAFADLAERHGYSPAEFIIRRRMEIQALIEDMRADIADDWSAASAETYGGGKGKRKGHLKSLEDLELAAIEIDMKMLEYEIPKKRSTDVNLDVGESLADLLRERNERRGG